MAFVDDDIMFYENAFAECRQIFLSRRTQYGNHLENAKRFPTEHEDALNLKACRVIRDHEAHAGIDKDTLIDIVNYAIAMLSAGSYR